MLFNQSDLDAEIQALHLKIQEKRMLFDNCMKEDMHFEEIKRIFLEIKTLTQRQELCFEESNIQKEA